MALEEQVVALAGRISELGEGERTSVFRMSWWSEKMLDWAMAHPSFKTQLFRFVDVFPATVDDADVVRHLEEYFDGADVPRVLDLGLGIADRVPFGKATAATVARRNIRRMAEQFIAGESPAAAVGSLRDLWRSGSAFVADLLGEKTVTAAEADLYAARVAELVDVLSSAAALWAPDDLLERDDLGPLPRVHVAVKPTALAPSFGPLTREAGLAEAKARLRPLLLEATRRDVLITLDMEHYDVKDVTLQLFRELLEEPELVGVDAGIVVQAYLRDCYDDLAELLSWSARRPRPVTVRLVKGAYWDSETVHADAEGWQSPVFRAKSETDASYERCTKLLHDHHGVVRAQFASHNLRSLAHAIAYARSVGIPDHGYELQMLYGMAEPVQAAIRRMGIRLRVYAPVGALLPGMAYLVRRLLENTSNESFVRHRFAEGRALDELLAPPVEPPTPADDPVPRRVVTDAVAPTMYAPEPLTEWRRAPARAGFAAAVGEGSIGLGADVPAVIDGEPVMTTATIASTDPAAPDRLVARSADCGPAEADTAVGAAREAWPAWRRTAVRERAAVLFRAAAWLRARRAHLAALEVYEVGKPWADADADVCEAIDFCEYYGREMLRLDAGGAVQSPPGEANTLRYQPRGVGAVIAPWNFPLAIPMGMVASALVTGNAVVLKPAEQAPAVAAHIVEAFHAAGLPRGVLSFLPGRGEVVGAHLVDHPDISFVSFTGSKAVGLQIQAAAARVAPGQRHIKRVLTELGGKNAIVVDADADLDGAIPAVVHSAFGFAGQKCSAASRLIVLDAIHDELVERLVGATALLRVGHPRDMGVQVGPVIDAEARDRLQGAVAQVGEWGRVVTPPRDLPDQGWFVPPTVVVDVDPASPLARDELFGPVLAVFRVATFEDAIALANDTDYALTAGVLSRSPEHVRFAVDELRAGNVYVNRSTTGAVVGRQPFGGYGLSGTGAKAGGPDYLLQLLEGRVVTENTVRQGFAPASDAIGQP